MSARADTFGFAEPIYLWLLFLPALLLLVWGWDLLRRRADAKRYMKTQVLARRERYSTAGDLPFWLCVVIAAGLCITALARPQYGVDAMAGEFAATTPLDGVRDAG